MRVLKEAVMTSNMHANGKALRRLAQREVVEVLQGPLRDESAGDVRIEARSFKDGMTGWITISGSMGPELLKEGASVFKVVKETILTESLSIEASAETMRKVKQQNRRLNRGEHLELLEWPVKEEESGLMRMKAKVRSTGAVGFVTTMGNQGTVFIDLV